MAFRICANNFNALQRSNQSQIPNLNLYTIKNHAMTSLVSKPFWTIPVTVLLFSSPELMPQCAFAQTSFSVIKNFTCDKDEGVMPYALTEGTDGALYGSMSTSCVSADQPLADDGPVPNYGFIFRMNKDGSDLKRLHTFDDQNVYFGSAQSLLLGTDGWLYGTSELEIYDSKLNGSLGLKQIFKLGQDGSGYQVLHSFPTYPDAVGDINGDQIFEGPDHLLYGFHGAVPETGVTSLLFRIGTDGRNY